MAKFIKSATGPENYYNHNGQEVCFIGRSNVGKSSLLNNIANSKIARTSKTPGRTRLINFFEWNNYIIVDLPGYGYSVMSKSENKEVDRFVQEYFLERKNLVMVFVLIDSKIGLTEIDVLMLNFLQENELNFFVVCTKLDKASQSEKFRTTNQVKSYTNNFLFVSSLSGKNIDLLKKVVINAYSRPV